MDSDRRRHPRLPMAVEVELHCPGQPVRVVWTDDLSCGGVSLVLSQIERPPLGTRVQVRVVGMLGEGEIPPLVDGLVVRHVGEGMAIQFADDSTQ